MNKPDTPNPARALVRAMSICADSEQACGDIEAKLRQWGLSPEDVAGIMARLYNDGYLNDERYARAFVHDRFTFTGWGRIKIAYQLKQKGIPDEHIATAMTTIDEEAYRQRLVKLLRAKWPRVKDREPRAAWAAMMRYATSRGYETAIASECVKQVTRLDVEDD